jgi:hypothetical protein
MEVIKLKKGFFVKVHVKVITDERLAIYEKMAYVALCRFVDREGKCFPGLDTLAHMAGCSRSRLYNALKKLEALGYVRITKRGTSGKRRSNLYILPLLNPFLSDAETKCVHQECNSDTPERHITISNIKEQDPGEHLEYTARTPQGGHETFTYVPNILPETRSETPSPVYLNDFKAPKKEDPNTSEADQNAPQDEEPSILRHPPYEEIIKSYVSHFPDREVPPLNDDMRFLMKIASMANHELFEIDGWERYFETVKGLPFLMGENPAGWRPPFKWLINPENIKHVKKGFFAPDGPVSILQEGKDTKDIKADLPEGIKSYLLGLSRRMEEKMNQKRSAWL